MNMKSLSLVASTIGLTLAMTGPIYAVDLGVRAEVKAQVRADIKEDRADNAGSRPGLLREFLKKGRAAIGSGTLTAKSGTTLTVTKDGKTYTVLTDSKTQFRRRFWGKGTTDEMQVGDTLNIIGLWTDDAKTTIQARIVRDISIQKRNGIFFGTVQSVTSTGWVMTTMQRGNQTVTVSSTTKFVDRREQTIAQSAIMLGHKVRVRGLWDKTNSTVTEVSHVKDFSLPVKPTPTVTTTVAPTPTSTPTPTPTP